MLFLAHTALSFRSYSSFCYDCTFHTGVPTCLNFPFLSPVQFCSVFICLTCWPHCSVDTNPTKWKVQVTQFHQTHNDRPFAGFTGKPTLVSSLLLARSQYPEGPATGHLDTGFSWFSCVYKRMLRWFPSFQVATTCLSCSPPDLYFLVTFFFPYSCTCKITTATGW